MAPKKGKNQVKRNNIKIKSKTNPQKRGLKSVKSRKLEEKPVDRLKWYNKTQGEAELQQINANRDWIDNSPYKKDFASSSSSEGDSSEYKQFYKPGAELRSCFTDISEECDCTCNYEKLPESKYGILKRKSSSTNSVVAKYIKSGMDHVASFIVESAIRFGKQHGVVVPDKTTPNVYEIMPPNDKRFFDDKSRRIRFRIPERALSYEQVKKLIYRRNPSRSSLEPPVKEYESPSNSAEDSLQEMIPLLEKFKKGGKIAKSEAELKKLEGLREREHTSAPPPMERERKRQREKEKSRDREKSKIREMELDRERGKEMEKERERERARHKARERVKKRVRAMERFKSAGAETEAKLQNPEYSKRSWKKFRQDSLELGRQRLRASTCPRKSDDMSETPTY